MRQPVTSSPFAKPPPPRAVVGTARHAPTRGSVTTINEDGSHYFLQPADAPGRFRRWRSVCGWSLIAFYVVLPWVPVNGYPAVFLDVAQRRFHLFGWTLAAQDMWLLFFLVSGVGFALIFVTAMLGRVWCGWGCPQTVYLEQVYRRIERWLEGDAAQRRALDAAPWNADKIFRRSIKHALYLLASLAITHLFLSYFVSLPELWSFMRAAPGDHWAAFGFVFVSAGVLYFNFAWFREQMCIVLCPYGRLQSALTDEHSLVIGYDAARGEPRGRLKTEYRGRKTEDGGQRTERKETAAKAAGSGLTSVVGHLSSAGAGLPSVASAKEGDCIDCSRCVQVCPTGIDIRHGLQMECIGCAACIDACDEIMTKVKRPTGLIRYDSLAGLTGARTLWLRPRTAIYGVLLVIGIAVAAFALSTVKPANFTVFRMGGAAYFVDRDSVRNQFMVRVLNKRAEPATFTLTVEGASADTKCSGCGTPITVASMAEDITPLVLVMDRKNYAGRFKFSVRLRDETGRLSLTREVEFLGPDPRLLQEEDHAKGVTR